METSTGAESQEMFKVNPIRHLKGDPCLLFSLQNSALSPVWKIWLGKVYRAPMPQWTLEMSNQYIQALKDESLLATPYITEGSQTSPGCSSVRISQSASPSLSFENSPTIQPESEQEGTAQDDSSQDGSSVVEPSYGQFAFDDTKQVDDEPLAVEEPASFNDSNLEKESPNFVYFRSSLDNYIQQYPYINNPQSL